MMRKFSTSAGVAVTAATIAMGMFAAPAAQAREAAVGGGGADISSCFGGPGWWSQPCRVGTVSGGWSGSAMGADMIGRNLVRTVRMPTIYGTVGYYSWRVDPVKGAGPHGETRYHTVMYGLVYKDRIPAAPHQRGPR